MHLPFYQKQFSKKPIKEIYENNSKYVGQWANDMPNGLGKLEENNGNYYEGTWVNGQANGKGKIIQANGEVFEGMFSNDEPFEDTDRKTDLIDETERGLVQA